MSVFRVLQFNMQFGQGWDEADPDRAPVRLDDTIAAIRAQNADLVFLQEVEQVRAGGTQVVPPPNYARLRAAFPAYHGTFGYPKPDPRELPFGVGLAILSRTPLTRFSRVDLSSPAVEFQFAGEKTTPTDRLLIGAMTTLGGREVRLLNTHLLAFFMLGTTSAEHPGQRERIAEELAASRIPTLLAGDFNVRDHGSLIAQYGRHGYRTAQDRETTWRRRPYLLDHVFYNEPLRCVATKVVPTLASDHHLLVADFEV